MSSRDPCIRRFIEFLDKATTRQTYDGVRELFRVAFDDNPVFRALRNEGALGKNLIVLVGGRGCGKTLAIRYIQHYFENRGWRLRYKTGADLRQENRLAEVMDDISRELEEDRSRKVVVAFDDIIEVTGAGRDLLKRQLIPLLLRYAGRLVVVLALQSERATEVTAEQFLTDVLGYAEHAQMFFGEEPADALRSSFRESYIRMRFVTSFRGASLVNLDAFWAQRRSLDRLGLLADTIVSIARFYAANAGDDCDRLVDELNRYKHALALLALASLPKLAEAHPEERTWVIIEYYTSRTGYEDPGLFQHIKALNGLGVAELLRNFLLDESLKEYAERVGGALADRLERAEPEGLTARDVKEALLIACKALEHVEVVERASLSSLGISLQDADEEQNKRRKRRGPEIDYMWVRRGAGARREESFLVLHHITTYRGYATSHALEKLEKLINLGVPSEAENRHLIVLAWSREEANAVLRRLDVKRLGRDVHIITAERLSGPEKTVIACLKGDLAECLDSQELSELARRVMLGSVVFKLRDTEGRPLLAYYLLPSVR